MDPKNRLQITAPTALLHFPLKLQETRVVEEPHGKAPHQRVVHATVDAVSTARVRKMAKSGRYSLYHGIKGPTV
jgi:hypothetical protein